MCRTFAVLFASLVLSLAGCDWSVPASVAGPPPEPAIDVGDGTKLLAEFRTDPAGSGPRWTGKRVRITASVTQADPNEGEPYLMLPGPIMVLPTPTESAKFGSLKAGAVVTVDGVVVAPAGGAPLMLTAATLVPTGQ